jgi:opacity protein-like surface antigen
MLKKIILASAIVASTISVAAASTPAPYVGTSVGVNTNTSTHANGGSAGVYRGVPVKLFAGYGGEMSQNVYLAGELAATLGSAEISNRNHMKTSYGYSISALPGVMVNDDTLAFARAGFVRSRFSNVNKISSGAQFGFGLQTAMTQHVDLRGEYDYTSYADANTINSPRTDEFNLGVVYKFD